MEQLRRCDLLNLLMDPFLDTKYNVAGSATGEIYLWQIGAKQATAGYTPIPATFGAAPPAASASIFATPSRAWNIDRPGALAALGHWGQPQSVRPS